MTSHRWDEFSPAIVKDRLELADGELKRDLLVWELISLYWVVSLFYLRFAETLNGF